ncbi:MAG: hypothetical protein LKE40_06425 [Spirochaetia bacterium]|nr:hypothetical protein [Spirochaetia bacterium]
MNTKKTLIALTAAALLAGTALFARGGDQASGTTGNTSSYTRQVGDRSLDGSGSQWTRWPDGYGKVQGKAVGSCMQDYGRQAMEREDCTCISCRQ